MLLQTFEIAAPPRAEDHELEMENAPVEEGEILVFPVGKSPRIELRFAGPYEPFLTIMGRRVVKASSKTDVQLLMWLGRRLPALFRALDLNQGLIGALTATGIEVTDVVKFEDQSHADHASVRRSLSECDIRFPAFAVLGPISGLGELSSRLRAMYASGTLLEVRREEAGRVLGRRRLRVGR